MIIFDFTTNKITSPPKIKPPKKKSWTPRHFSLSIDTARPELAPSTAAAFVRPANTGAPTWCSTFDSFISKMEGKKTVKNRAKTHGNAILFRIGLKQRGHCWGWVFSDQVTRALPGIGVEIVGIGVSRRRVFCVILSGIPFYVVLNGLMRWFILWFRYN